MNKTELLATLTAIRDSYCTSEETEFVVDQLIARIEREGIKD